MTNQEQNDRPLRVLVVDDSALYRKVVSTILAESSNLEVVGTATDGKIAMQKIEELGPDLLTLDLEMPQLDGIGVLREIERRKLKVGAIVLSAFSKEGAKATTRALDAGAFDFVLKPASTNPEESKSLLRSELLPKVRAYGQSFRRTSSEVVDKCSKGLASSGQSSACLSPAKLSVQPELIAIGISTGGPQSLRRLIPKLSSQLPVPILIVQHMPPVFTASLAEELDKYSELTVREASHGDRLRPGVALIAPGGKQMKVRKGDSGIEIEVNEDPPERNCRPSVDYLFRSLSDTQGSRCLALIMTGMGDDGLLGCRLLKRKGARIVAQDEASSVVYGMPRQIVENGLADVICPLERIHLEINNSVNGRAVACS